MFKKCVLAAGICAVAGFGVAQQASAVSPYDMPYSIQWNFQSGGGSTTATDMDVTADGVAHLITRGHNFQSFGEGATGSINGDVGGVDALGNLVYGLTVRSVPGMTSPNQNYPAGANAAGNKVYYGFNAAGGQHWNDPGSIQDPVNEIGKQSNTHSVFSIDSSLVAKTGQLDGNASLTTAIGDRNSLAVYSDNAGTPRADGNQPITTGLSQLGVQTRTTDSAMRASTLDIIMVNDMVSGDFGTLGDYGGWGQRNPAGDNAYFPGIARYNPTTKVMDGPAKQPTLAYVGPEAGWGNMGVYVEAGVDQASGWYYGGGIAQSRNFSKSNQWDPDGSGPASAIAFGPSIPANFADDHRLTTPGIGTAYDASNNLQYAVTWDTAGYDIINAIVGVGDGSNSALWAGEQEDDAYFELRDSTGAVQWSVDLDFSLGTDPERISEIDVVDGEVYIQGYYTNSVGGSVGDGSGGRDSFIAKYDLSGNEIWTKLIQGGATETAGDGRANKDAIHVYSTSDGQWDNTTGYVHASGSNLLLQKLVPGDQNADGIVDVDDACAIGLAVHPGSAVDTWDFDEDGDSDPADYIYFVENVLDWTRGDNDIDGDVDTADITDSIISFTGAVGAAGGKCHDDGDTDGDGDVDTADLTTSITNFTGALAGNPNVPDLVYDPATGNVTIDADGADVISFSLQSGPFNAADFSELPAGLTDNIASQIGWTSFNLFSGLTGTANLGAILPAGLDQAGLEAALTTASYGLALAGGGGGGRLDLIIPEPASMVLMGLGAVALVRRRRAA